MKSGIIVVVALLALVLLTSVTAMNVGYVMAADDSGSGSSSGSDGGGSSSGNNDGGNSDKGSNDNSGDNNNNNNNDNNNDKKINDPLNPKKEDTKDISDIPEENGSHCLTNECPTKQQEPVARCDSIGCNPTTDPQPPPTTKPISQIININIILKTIHGHTHGHSNNNSPTHGLSDACYTAMKQVWAGNIHVGQNAEIDKFMAGCLV